MPYDYAREIDDCRDDIDDDRLDLSDVDDDGPSRSRSQHRCSDRMCGALDCSNCHPGNCDHEEEE